MDRKLTVILAADIAGYSRLMEADEESAYEALHQCRRVIDGNVAARKGRIFNTAGDSVVAEFASPVEAVRAALRIQNEIVHLNSGRPPDRQVKLRIGINLGDVMVDGDNLLGDGVNVAARLQELAAPGGVMISESIYMQVRSRLRIEVKDRGQQTLKNLTHPVHVYEALQGEEMGPVHRPRQRLSTYVTIGGGLLLVLAVIAIGLGWPRLFGTQPNELGLSGQSSIAIMPLSSLGGGPDLEAISDGMTNDIITDLSKLRGLFVISSTSSFALKDKPMIAQDIGRMLGVRYLLEGSMQLAGEKLRINAQLIDATTGRHLWAERYEKPAQDSFDIQDEIVRSIVEALEVKVSAADLERAIHRGTDNMDARQLRTEARRIFSDPERWTQAWWKQARDWLEQALKLEPEYAEAISDLAYVHYQDWNNDWGEDPEGSLDLAISLADKAVKLEPENWDLHWTVGILNMSRPEGFERGLAAYARAMEFNPNNPDLKAEYGEALIVDGRAEEAITTVLDAIARTPINQPYWYKMVLAKAYYHTGQYEMAVSTMNAIDPLPDNARMISAAAYAQLGDVTKASSEMSKFRDAMPDWTIETAAQSVFKDPAYLERWLDGLKKAGLPVAPEKSAE